MDEDKLASPPKGAGAATDEANWRHRYTNACAAAAKALWPGRRGGAGDEEGDGEDIADKAAEGGTAAAEGA
jgi:hypothetical protein